MLNKLENKYEGMVDGVYEGWFIVLYQDETKARVMWSSMKDLKNVVSVMIEDWTKFADGNWGATKVVADLLGYNYSEEMDLYQYNRFKDICLTVNEEPEEER